MAQRRMFSLKIVDTDAFLDMPQSSQLLYFHLSMRADDDGFVGNPKKIMKMVGSADDDLRVLFAKRFLISFDTGVCVIKHWRIHNLIRIDRYTSTSYIEEKNTLTIKENGSYTDSKEDVIPNGNQVAPQVRIGEVRKGEESKDIDTPKEFSKRFFDGEAEVCGPIAQALTDAGISPAIVARELMKFKEYWIEQNKSGTKQRWELEKTFDVKLRIKRWFRNIAERSQTRPAGAGVTL